MYPDATTLYHRPDTVILEVRRSYRSIISQVFYFGLSLSVYVALLSWLPAYESYLRWLAIVPVGILLNIFRTYYNDLARLEHHKVTQHYGRLALSYEMPSVKYVDIRALNVHQDIFGRIFDYGDLRIGCAGGKDWEMTIHGVRTPHELLKLLEELRTLSTNFALQHDQSAGLARAALVSRE